MSGKPAARLGDPTACPIPGHGSNPISAGSPDVLFDGLPAARQGDPTRCGSALADNVIPNVLINGQPATTLGTLGSHGNVVIEGSATVIIGNSHTPAPFTPPEPLNLGTVALAAAGQSLPDLAQALATPQARAWQEEPGDFAPLGLEEEDEEEELEEQPRQRQQQSITLRLGLFFDGTGNNQANSEAAAGCYAVNLGLTAESAEDIRQRCAAYGYNGNGNTPDNSYGNDTSNIARLYQLYPDQVDEKLPADAGTAYLAVYLEGIGTSSGAEDSLYSQITGLGSTGILARVRQAPALILEKLRRLQVANPDVQIRHIEIDLFGFSRGAAAARHCANDLLKGAGSLLAKALPAGSPLLIDGFAWHQQQDFALNFIGLFDSVAAVVDPLRGDFVPHNAHNPGLDLGLAPGCARQVVQLVAEHEFRHNFPLTRTDNDIRLPGAHSDIGGGYLPQATEKIFLSRPDSSLVNSGTANEQTPAYRRTHQLLERQRSTWLPYAQHLEISPWAVAQPFNRQRDLVPQKRVYAAISSEREVRGELSLIYLRIMRELAVRAGVALKPIPDTAALRLPDELQPIAIKLQAQALGGTFIPLTSAENALLQRRYIHLSAHWNAAKGKHNSALEVVFANRPAEGGKRMEHPNA